MRGLLGILAVVAAIALWIRLLVALGIPEARVTSWWRSPWHNWAVGGKWNSLHQVGWAVDLVPRAGVSLPELARRIRARRLLPIVVYGDADHLDHVHAQL